MGLGGLLKHLSATVVNVILEESQVHSKSDRPLTEKHHRQGNEPRRAMVESLKLEAQESSFAATSHDERGAAEGLLMTNVAEAFDWRVVPHQRRVALLQSLAPAIFAPPGHLEQAIW